MNRLRLLVGLIAATATAATLAVVLPERATTLPPVQAVPEHGDPRERVDREVLRLRDPATGRIPDGIRRREIAFASTLPSRHTDALLKGAASGLTFDWQQRGPSNIGGRTRALAFDASDSRTLLAGAITGGMWRSTDQGLSWRRSTTPGQLPSVTWVEQDTRAGRTSTWYYGTGEYRTNSTRFGNTLYSGDGIFKSTDGGRTFQQLASTVTGAPEAIDQPFDFVNRIEIDPSNTAQDEVYAAAMGTIMRSVDGGATWQTALGAFNGVEGYSDVAVTPSGVVYAALGSRSSNGGLWRSEDGVTWDEITPTQWGDSLRRAWIAIAPSDPEYVYALGFTPGAGKSIPGTFEVERLSLGRFRNGTWEDFSQNIPTLGGAWNYTSLSGYAFFLSVHPTDPNSVILGGANLFLSTDGFATASGVRWLGGYGQDQSYGAPGTLHPDMHIALWEPGNPDVLWAGNDGGIYRTTDWQVPAPFWEQRNTGYVTTQFYTVAIDPLTPGSQLISGGAQDNGTLTTDVTDVTSPWDWVRGGDGAFTQIAEGGRVLYVSSQYEGLVRFERNEAGEVIGGLYLGGPQMGAVMFVNPYTLDASDPTVLYYAAGRQLARNRDHTAEPPAWEPVLGTAYASGVQVSAVASSRDNPSHRVWYASGDGRVWMLDNAHEGTPTGRNATSPLFPQKGYINCVAVDPRDGDRAVVVFSNYNVLSLFMTEDGGTTWTPIAGNLEENPDGTGSGPSCRWAEFLHTAGGTVLLVGTSTGLYSTTAIDGMSTVWRQEGAETIGNVIVDMIDARESDGMVAVATWANGIFSAVAQPSGIVRETGASAALLGAAYPNPSRGMVTIPYAVPASLAGADVRLTLIDVAGRSVAEFHAGRPGAGSHTHRFDAGALEAGRYYYRIAVGGATETRPLTIVE